MTRRRLAHFVLAGAASGSACATGKQEIVARLRETCKIEGLTIVGTPLGRDSGYISVPGSIPPVAPDSERLELPGSARPPHLVSIAPDGAWVAWVPEGSLPDSFGSGGKPVVSFTNNRMSGRTARFNGWFGEQLALSSNASHLALVIVAKDLARRLVVLNPATSETECDLTALINRFSLKQVECMSFSASGNRLTVGSPESFAVLDVPNRMTIFEGEGRFPRLAPSGDVLAFVNPRRRLVLAALGSGATRTLLDGVTTRGIGAWTPDGTLLLAGVNPLLAFFWRLVAVDCNTNSYAEIVRLDEHDLGAHYAFVKRSLLSQNSAKAAG